MKREVNRLRDPYGANRHARKRGIKTLKPRSQWVIPKAGDRVLYRTKDGDEVFVRVYAVQDDGVFHFNLLGLTRGGGSGVVWRIVKVCPG